MPEGKRLEATARIKESGGVDCKGGLNECDKEASKASKSDAGAIRWICLVCVTYFMGKYKYRRRVEDCLKRRSCR